MRPIRISRGSKYRNVKVEADGHTFDSKAEYARYCELKVLEKAGKIANLHVHSIFALHVKNAVAPGYAAVGIYEADFCYDENSKHVVEDVKGVRTAVYRLKRKLMKALYGIDIVEIHAGRKRR